MPIPQSFLNNLSSLRSQHVAVTGGAGFLGGHIVQQLADVGCRVTVFDRVKPKKEVQGNVSYISGDLCHIPSLLEAFKGCDIIIHVASPSPLTKDKNLFEKVNVQGTAGVIQAAKQVGVTRLVYTASASVLFDGHDQKNLDETTKDTSTMDDYTQTKSHAEKLVLEANDEQFATCSIRPHGIFGPGDPHLIPSVALAGRAGKSKYILGYGNNLVDFTYVENVAYAHLLAASQLKVGSSLCRQAYLITNRQPILFWDFLTRLQAGLGYPLPYIPIPLPLLLPITDLLTAASRIIPFKPTFDRQKVTYAGVHHYYSCEKAVRDMGYIPPISLDEGIKRTLAYFVDEYRSGNKPTPQPESSVYRSDAFMSIWMEVFLYLAITLLTLLCILIPALLTPSTSISTFLAITFSSIVILATLRYWRNSSFGCETKEFKDDTLSLKGKHVVITGGNRGIGYESALRFAQLGAHVTIACRDPKSAQSIIDRMKLSTNNEHIDIVTLNLSSFQSVRTCVDELGKHTPIDILVNNAGAVLPHQLTQDGIEEAVQANYLGHVLFTELLLRRNILTSDARIVNVSSLMHRLCDSVDINDITLQNTQTSRIANVSTKTHVYNQTKLYMLLYTYHLQHLIDTSTPTLHRRTVVAVNPGAVATDFIHHFIPSWLASMARPLLNLIITYRTPAAGAHSTVYAACSRELNNVGGVYIDNCDVVLPSRLARDQALQKALYHRSLQIVGL